MKLEASHSKREKGSNQPNLTNFHGLPVIILHQHHALYTVHFSGMRRDSSELQDSSHAHKDHSINLCNNPQMMLIRDL